MTEEKKEEKKKNKISYSQVKYYNECGWKYKLLYLDKKFSFVQNEYTIFGTCVHTICEKLLKNEIVVEQSKDEFSKLFDESLLKTFSEEEIAKNKNIENMKSQGRDLVFEFMNTMKKEFGDFEVVSNEERLEEWIDDFLNMESYFFSGYIDLVIKTSKGKYYIIDMKTTSWNWSLDKRRDPITSYQLTLYKKYYSQKHNIDPKNIDTCFVLLKRGNTKEPIEVLKITSGQIKTRNALNLLQESLKNIQNQNFNKNRDACKNCPFKNTQDCPND